MANKHDGRSSQLLSEAETWTASVIEERAVELVRIATRGLTMSDSSYDTRMDCLRWLGERLVTHIDVFDLEELVNILKEGDYHSGERVTVAKLVCHAVVPPNVYLR